MIYPPLPELSLPGMNAIALVFLPLVPIVFLLLNSNRKACGRSWHGQILLIRKALRNAVSAERSIWITCIASAVAWKICFEFWPLPVPFDAANATISEIATVFLGTALLCVWFVGGIVAAVRTLNRISSQMECRNIRMERTRT